MRASTRKSFRDLWRQRAQVIAVGVTIALGVLIYIATAGAFQNLSASYQETYDRLSFADLVATGGDTADVAQAALDAGASDAITRTQIDPPMLIDDAKLLGRVLSVPVDEHPVIDDVDVIDGDYLDGTSGDVLLETHAAEAFDLAPGDSFDVYTATGWQSVTIAGVVDSPEYLWPARSRQDILSDPQSFAVVYASTDDVSKWFGIPDNQTLVLLPDSVSTEESDAVSDAMTDAGATSVETQEDQPSNATLSEDLQGFDQMSVAFPALFLIAAGVSSWVLLTRRILQERPIIGTLMAAGARRGRVLRHYLGQGLIIGTLGAIVGVVLGVFANTAVTSAYTGFVGVPDTVVRNYPWMIVVGLLFGAVIGMLGALGPAITASRTAPAEAMRTQAEVSAPGAWSRFVARQRWLPTTTRMALRDIVRSKRRTFATMLGGVLALVLVLTSVGLMTSMLRALEIQFDEVNLEDATVAAQSGAGVEDQLRDLEGVSAVEPTAAGKVTVLGSDDSYATVLHGFQADTQMHGFVGMDGAEISLPDDGILAGHSIGELLDVEEGDTVTLSTEDGQTDVTIVAFVDEPIGTAVYATDEVAASILPDTGVESFALLYANGADRDQLRANITQLDGVVAYQDVRAVVGILDDYLGLFWAFIGIMIVAGTILALAVMYVTMAVSVVERIGELATMRAAGAPRRKVAGAIATENMLATLLAIPIGLILGVWSASTFLQTFNDDLFTLELRWSWWTLPAAALGVLLAALISQWPAARQIKKIDIARVVRERAP
ncbi:FtsX-like permease family protein [Microbacterium sp. C7(2022)]|uniref:FtsX-like permease family protein n=1 Tax=Microbacterium sp. C7(2022) TaxID=2992759 RepID=UPI00237B46B3|nr:ABC transporter permease [Microbacterium sp. C7(2022)]MDE0546048.1 ABC transporter permease [Microbacterium sp. C7(2022)]